MGQLKRDNNQRADNSLRGKALSRAQSGKVPRTLTPYEWEQWYAEHGTPIEHCQSERHPSKTTSWFGRMMNLGRRSNSIR